MSNQTYYQVTEPGEGTVVFETLKSALEYAEDCLYGLDLDYSVTIKIVQMTSDEFNQLSEM